MKTETQTLVLVGVAAAGLFFISMRLKEGTKRLAASEKILKKGEEVLGVDLADLADRVEDYQLPDILGKFGGSGEGPI